MKKKLLIYFLLNALMILPMVLTNTWGVKESSLFVMIFTPLYSLFNKLYVDFKNK